MSIDMTGLNPDAVTGLKSLTGRKSREDYLGLIVQYLKLEQESPEKAMAFLLAESERFPQFGRDFLGVNGLDDGVECYSPNIDSFFLIDPNGEYKDGAVINPRQFKVFLRSGATTQWDGGGPHEEGYASAGDKLSTFEKPNLYFPGFKCIDTAVDMQLRQLYNRCGFNIPLGEKVLQNP